MRSLSVLLTVSFLLLSSCVEHEIEAYDSLTPAEQDEIRERGEQLCLEKSGPEFENFKNQSNEVFLSTGYDRGNGFLTEFTGGSVTKKLEVKIWKRTSEALYFYISSENSDDFFLKISILENIQMINALKAAYCARPETYTSSFGGSVLSMKSEYILPKAPYKEKYIDTYRLPFNSLVAFANYRITRTRGTFNVDDQQTDTTVKYESKITSKTFTFESDNSNSSEYNQKFCSLDFSGGYLFLKERGQEGFKYTCTETVPPVGWNLSV